jgi:hypothetical protein
VISDVISGSKLEIWDMQGRIVHSAVVVNSGSYECNINLPSGVYGVSLGGDEAGKKLKMIVQ